MMIFIIPKSDPPANEIKHLYVFDFSLNLIISKA